ncbi:hypothetical protein GGP81_001342 [Salinibacter ruber]|uniref:hypothetical protein n=2 Tax=Salinibacter ruber TaxID=146919 RepID=UPI0021680ADC|nr:hypothetical protein [Salinibacter ruber]MCS3954833.1 hypothetical protein [Salinibacter ruber]
MKNWVLLSTWLIAAVLAMPQLAAAQAIKLHKKTTAQGEIDRTPYITYAKFEAASVGRAIPSKSFGEEVTFVDLISVSSIDEVKRIFGEPGTLTHGSPYEDVEVVYAFLTYDGLRFEYVKYDKKYKLRELELTSPDWSFTVNGTQLRPGMSVDQLSPAVRQSLNRDFGESVDAFGAIVVAKPGTAKQAKRGGELQQMGDMRIQIEVNRGTVARVSFGRMLL